MYTALLCNWAADSLLIKEVSFILIKGHFFNEDTDFRVHVLLVCVVIKIILHKSKQARVERWQLHSAPMQTCYTVAQVNNTTHWSVHSCDTAALCSLSSSSSLLSPNFLCVDTLGALCDCRKHKAMTLHVSYHCMTCS